MPIKTLGSLGKIRVGRVTGNTHIFFFGLRFLNFNRTTENFSCNLPKIQELWVFRQKDANGIANSGDPDQTAPLGAV